LASCGAATRKKGEDSSNRSRKKKRAGTSNTLITAEKRASPPLSDLSFFGGGQNLKKKEKRKKTEERKERESVPVQERDRHRTSSVWVTGRRKRERRNGGFLGSFQTKMKGGKEGGWGRLFAFVKRKGDTPTPL